VSNDLPIRRVLGSWPEIVIDLKRPMRLAA
jgi:hypothetical protein